MTYRENPSHGRPVENPPAKRSKQVSVRLQGGPRDGDLVTYGQPLPKTLVVYSDTEGWTDYHRKPRTTVYEYPRKAPHGGD